MGGEIRPGKCRSTDGSTPLQGYTLATPVMMGLTQRLKTIVFKGNCGAPGGIRTPDPLLRRQTLFPTELRAHPFLTSLLYYDFHRIFDFDFGLISWNTWNNCGIR